MGIDQLARAKYVSLETVRKDGTVVATPVWLAREGDRLLITTQGSSGKVRRIRNNPSVRLAPCNSRGHLRGDYVAGTATVLEGAQAARITALISRKYGLLGRILTRRGDASDRVALSVALS